MSRSRSLTASSRWLHPPRPGRPSQQRLVNRKVTVDEPDRLWITDITERKLDAVGEQTAHGAQVSVAVALCEASMRGWTNSTARWLARAYDLAVGQLTLTTAALVG